MSIISACDKAGGVYRCTYITLPLADISYAGEVIRRSEASQVGTLTLVDCEKKHKSHVSSAARGGEGTSSILPQNCNSGKQVP